MRYGVPAGICAATFGVYLATMAPTVTWRNGGADGAELSAAAYTWGVAHPPGYPLYLTLVRLFQLLPAGDLAHRAALFSAAAAAAACAMVYATGRALLGGRRPGGGSPVWIDEAGPAFGALTFAFGILLWSQAVIAEVYTLGALLFALFLWALVRWLEAPGLRRAVTVGVTLALLISHQPTFAVALAPLAWVAWRRRAGWRVVTTGLACLALAPLLFGSLWLRALGEPALNWGQPDTLSRWLAHVTAQMYRGYFFAYPLPAYWPRVPYAAALIARQGGWIALGATALGAAWLWQARRDFAVFASVLAAFFVAFAVLYTASDSEIYILPSVQLCALAAGVGAAWVWRETRFVWRTGAALAAVASVGWQVISTWPAVDVSRDTEARVWGERTLDQAPANAVIRSTTDQQTFVLWYLEYAEGRRPDVAVVDDRLLSHAWYRAQLLRRYPQLVGQHIAD